MSNSEQYIAENFLNQAEALSAEFERDRRRYGRELSLEVEENG